MSGNDERPIETFGNSEMLLEMAQAQVIRMYDSKKSLCLGLRIDSKNDIKRIVAASLLPEGHVMKFTSAFGTGTFKTKFIEEIRRHLPVLEQYMSKKRNDLFLLLYELEDGRWVGLAPTRMRGD